MSAELNLKKLNIELPPASTPVANYVSAVHAGNFLYLAGHIPVDGTGKPMFVGKVGLSIGVDEAYQAARLVGLNLLGTARHYLGSLDKVKRVVKALGMVNAAPGFVEMPRVVNGFSDLIVEVFGPDIGRHARSAIGVAELPKNVPVEVEMILEVY